MEKHLLFYQECINVGFIPGRGGLCNLHDFIDTDLLKLFQPSQDERYALNNEGLCNVYWGSGKAGGAYDLGYDGSELCNHFSPLRQTIVLFMAAINGEL